MKKMTAIDFVRYVLNDQLNLGEHGNTEYLRISYKILDDYKKDKKITRELEEKLREIEEFIEKVNREKIA